MLRILGLIALSWLFGVYTRTSPAADENPLLTTPQWSPPDDFLMENNRDGVYGWPEVNKEAVNLHWLVNGSRILVTGVTYLDNNQNGLVDQIQWTVPHLSNQTYEISITILNPYSYLRDGDTWVVAFNTTGVGNCNFVITITFL